MQHQSTPESVSDPSSSASTAQSDELQRRIATLEALDDSELGEFKRIDWAICILGALVIPGLLLMWIGR